VAPQRVLLDGGSFYSIVGAKLKAQLGLSEGDMDPCGHRVHTATEKIEMLQDGLIKLETSGAYRPERPHPGAADTLREAGGHRLNGV
jgi:hypothetical protein